MYCSCYHKETPATCQRLRAVIRYQEPTGTISWYVSEPYLVHILSIFVFSSWNHRYINHSSPSTIINDTNTGTVIVSTKKTKMYSRKS